jgi:two-component system, NarL family, sensor histidine kinase UhpB
MLQSPSPSPVSSTTQLSARRDVMIVIIVTVASAYLAGHFELNERVFSLTRGYEHMQLDEWPIVVFVLALCLMWMSWRRYRHAAAELHARQLAEASLTEALAQNRELARQNLRALEDERKHLARELHDELGQYLNAIKLDAVAVGDSANEDAQSQASRSARMLATVDHIHGVVSDMIRRLRPAGLDELGLLAAIESCIDQWQQRSPRMQFHFSAHGNLEGLSEHVNLTVYRLVQEGITNSYKHSEASRIDVALTRGDADDDEGNMLALTIYDNGKGGDAMEQGRGMGLNGMRERVEMLGGQLTIDTAPGKGFTLEARIPTEGKL